MTRRVDDDRHNKALLTVIFDNIFRGPRLHKISLWNLVIEVRKASTRWAVRRTEIYTSTEAAWRRLSGRRKEAVRVDTAPRHFPQMARGKGEGKTFAEAYRKNF
jgi:hypothetical protein